jgi:hypothetical protein
MQRLRPILGINQATKESTRELPSINKATSKGNRTRIKMTPKTLSILPVLFEGRAFVWEADSALIPLCDLCIRQGVYSSMLSYQTPYLYPRPNRFQTWFCGAPVERRPDSLVRLGRTVLSG